MKKQTKKQLLKKQKRLEKREIKNKYKEWIKKIKERDNYTCQISGKYFKNAKPQALQAAHILSKENYPKLMFDINNGISLSFYNHKNSKLSPHLDGFCFVEFFKNKFPDRYNYLLNKLKEINENEK